MTKVGVIMMDSTRVIGNITVDEEESIELGGIARDTVTCRFPTSSQFSKA